MTDLFRIRPIAGPFGYKIPLDELTGFSQNGFNKLKGLHFHDAPLQEMPLWPALSPNERTQVTEALSEMSFNKARLIQKEFACLMIALAPMETFKKAQREGFLISVYGATSTSSTAPSFTDYLPLAQEYAHMVGVKQTCEFADVFSTFPLRLGVAIANSSAKFISQFLSSSISESSPALRLHIAGDKARNMMREAINLHSTDPSWVPYRKMHACDLQEPFKAIRRGAYFDPDSCPDKTSIGQDCPALQDFNWRSRLLLPLVGRDEQADYLVALVAKHPTIQNVCRVLANAMVQEPEALRPAIGSMPVEAVRSLLKTRVLDDRHVGWVSPAARDHFFSADLGL